MSTPDDDRQPASPASEQDLRSHFPFETMSAEEYAARNAADIASFSLDQYRYSDPIFDRWIQRLGEVLNNRKLLTECRAQYLTPDEIAEALEREQDPF